MRAFIFFFTIAMCTLTSCDLSRSYEVIQLSDDLEVRQLTDHVWMHISYMDVHGYGRVPCNGLIYESYGDAIIMDTPFNDSLTAQLLDWIEEEHHFTIQALVINHFHNDCAGGIQQFHNRNITTYSLRKSCELSQAKKEPCAQELFDDFLSLNIGKAEVQCAFHGEAHTRDNVVTWIPSEKVLFGGCMVKSLDAEKGYLNDANEAEWSNTIQKVKVAYPDAELIVPGHGKPGGVELLDYTIQLFEH